MNWQDPYLIDVQLYEHPHVGMLRLNCLHIKTNATLGFPRFFVL